MPKQPQKMTFAMMRELVESGKLINDEQPYIDQDVAVLRTNIGMVWNVLQLDTPLRIDDYRCGIVDQGTARVTINLIEKQLREGMVAIVTPGSIIQPIEASKDFQLSGMAMKSDLLHIAMGGRLPQSLNRQMTDFQIRPDEADFRLISALFDNICALVHTPQFSHEVLHSLIATQFRLYDHVITKNEAQYSAVPSNDRHLFNRFIQLVNRHARQQHQLAFYASELCLTERYLGTVIKKVSGISAKEWIDRAIITDAKVLLRHSAQTVSQIADTLSFPNPSFFCKYFKRLTTMTPQEYRAQ